jgi:hypothetical protein
MSLTAVRATRKSVFAILLLGSAMSALAQSDSGEWSLNGFRNPSVGLEYRKGDYSVHAGYYSTILRDPGSARSEASGFARVGATRWFDDRWYVSASALRGVDGPRDGRNFVIVEAGAQVRPHPKVALRLGVAVIPAAHGFKTKVNPTPGVSLVFKP